MSFLVKACSHPVEEERERVGCFAIIMLLRLCDCLCSIPLSHIAVDWYAVCVIPGHTQSVGNK